jgi:putative tricarboxylic transport membrane protein
MGGAITAILLNTPGQAANVVTCLDGFPLAQQGKAGLAIGAAASSNALGGLIGTVSVLAVLPLAQDLVMSIAPPEFFLLAVLGMLLISTISQGRLLRSLITAGLGLMLSTVGYSGITGTERFTFGSDYLWDGVNFSAALIGVFAVAEMMNLLVKGGTIVETSSPTQLTNISEGLRASLRHWRTLLQGSVIGTVVGAIPGMGGGVAAFLSYSVAVKSSPNPETFGKGNIKGIIATESAMNAKDGSMLIPTLALGIPGGAEMVVFMGILTLHGMQPGPLMLVNHQAEIYALIWALTASCVAASILGILLARPLARITAIDSEILAPVIIAIAFAGSYAIDREIENVLTTAFFGLIGFAMIRFNFPRAAFVISMVLGGIAERSFHQSMMMTGGEWSIFVSRPVSQLLIAVILAAAFGPALLKRAGLSLDRRDIRRKAKTLDQGATHS